MTSWVKPFLFSILFIRTYGANLYKVTLPPVSINWVQHVDGICLACPACKLFLVYLFSKILNTFQPVAWTLIGVPHSIWHEGVQELAREVTKTFSRRKNFNNYIKVNIIHSFYITNYYIIYLI